MATTSLKQFAEVLDAIERDYSLQADRECREAVRESHDAEKVIAAREALARHEVAEQIRDLLLTHDTVSNKRLRTADGRFARLPGLKRR